MKHYVEFQETNNFFHWAVKWKDKIVCLCASKEWADQVAEALDGYRPYEENLE